MLLVVHLAFVGWLSLRPLDVPWMTAANLQPFAGIKADLALGPAEATRRIGEALLLLAPLGILLPAAGGRLHASVLGSFLRTVAAGAMISLGIELLQTAVPGQLVDIDSLMLNTAGVAIAHLAIVPAVRARIRRQEGLPPRAPLPRDEVAQGPTPTIPRVGIAP